MLKVLKFFLVLFFLLVMTLAGLVFFALESQPLVVANSSQQVGEADSVKELMRQISESLKNRSKHQTITLSNDQLNSLVGFVQRAHKQFSGKVSISTNGMTTLASYQLPDNPLGQYLNIDITILPSQGIDVEHVRVGALSIPGNVAVSMVTTMVNWYTKSDLGDQFIAQVESVAMNDDEMMLNIRPLNDFLNELNTVKQGMDRTGDEELRLRTAYYLTFLSQQPEAKSSRSQSLATFISPLFAKAQSRSSYDTAVKENEAAILALAIFAGHHRFANFVGEVQPSSGTVVKPRAPTVLAKRVDLSQHFIFSAAIKILSEQGLSIAIGEFKELMDRGQGGSGYSFVDLSADYAGVKFAQTATEPEKALGLQRALASNSSEGVFFPSIKDLPEGFSKTEFTQRFDKVDSPEYLKLVNEIHHRIDALALHQ
ncbi:MAG: hypothetical protein NWQ54_02870 [Paraglaciecola sp.]|nr:hypothetical protein [Paraglaciecola sp.]